MNAKESHALLASPTTAALFHEAKDGGLADLSRPCVHCGHPHVAFVPSEANQVECPVRLRSASDAFRDHLRAALEREEDLRRAGRGIIEQMRVDAEREEDLRGLLREARHALFFLQEVHGENPKYASRQIVDRIDAALFPDAKEP